MIGDVIIFLAALAIALILRLTVAELVRVRGSSMLPTLRTGQWLLVSRLDYRLGRPRRGDVVICHYPGRYMDRWKLIPQCFVKRVIGLPGETIEIIEGVVHIGGEPLSEPYLDPARCRFRRQMPARTLGEDEYFVLGDNRDSSNDSRRIGPLPRGMLVGRVRRVIFPFGHHPLDG
ncbi:MAG: signal peptidase I [Aristaeellaceae bacterium]